MPIVKGNQEKMRKGWKLVLSIVLVIFLSILEVDQITLPVTETLELHMIDVGQGDSILLRQGEHAMLIDCGTPGKGDNVIQYLEEIGVKKLEVLVGTHPHDDHMGGMAKVIRHLYDTENKISKIGAILAPDNSEDNITTTYYEEFVDAVLETGVEWKYPKVGEEFPLGEAKVRIIAPNSEKYSAKNNYSIGLYVSFGEVDIVLTGDAEEMAEQEMIENGLLAEAEILKAGHHGSDTSNTEKFLDVVNPKYMLISAGIGNKYKHPIDSVMKRLQERGITVYRTDESGTVVMTTNGQEIQWNVSAGDYLSGVELKRKLSQE